MSAITPARQVSFFNGDTTITADGSGIKFANGSTRSETATIGQSSSNNVVSTSSQADSLVIRGYGQTVNAGAGDDSLVVENASYGSVDGGAGDDLIEVRGTNYWSTLRGGEGSDTVRFGSASTDFHVRDEGSQFGFVWKGGSITRVSKDVEQVAFADGRSFTREQLTNLAATSAGALDAAGQNTPTTALTVSVGAGALQRGSQFDDHITISSVGTVDSGAGHDTIVDTKGFHARIDSGSGNDTVSLADDWASRTKLGDGDDRLNLGGTSGGGHARWWLW
jgi:hypothetical protein